MCPSWLQTLRKALKVEEKHLHAAFIPTGCWQLLNLLSSHFPRHQLIAADFEHLPPPDLPDRQLLRHPDSMTALRDGTLSAMNAPLVSSKQGGNSRDYPTYLLTEAGSADIFFPTSFPNLRKAYSRIMRRNLDTISIPTSKVFLTKHAQVQHTKTLLGYVFLFFIQIYLFHTVVLCSYNPLLSDFSNTRFCLSSL